jgi:hypothetical protein
MKVALRTSTGNYVTAVNDGGMGDPPGLPFNSTAVHTNAAAAGPWEKFTLVNAGDGKIAIKTSGGQYVTAVNGGGMTDPPGFALNTTAVHTNAKNVGPWETFTLVPLGSNQYTLQAGDGKFVNAVNGGGIGDPSGQPFNSWPIHTNASKIGPWEKFDLIVIEG